MRWVIGEKPLQAPIDIIIPGKHSASLDAKKLTLGIDLPVKWNDQRAALGMNASQ